MANVLADDFDQTVHTDDKPVLPWTFTYGPRNKPERYEIDLTEENYQKLVDALAPFVEVAREVEDDPKPPKGVSRARSSSRTSPDELNKIREWARANGHEVSDRGRISGKVMEAYEAAN